MSSYSFSHQFYQHWTGAPEPVRAAIVQELTDITDLLQTETPFEKFVFTTHDLNAHLDDLYCVYDLQQAAAKKQADEQAAEEQRLEEQNRLIQQAKDKEEEEERKAREEKAQQATLAAAANKVADITEEDSEPSKQDTQSNKTATTINPVKAVADTLSSDSAINLTLKDSELNAEHEALLSELDNHIDDYLTEQMLLMSENLKSWLRVEVSRQLTDKDQAVKDKEKG